MNEFELRAYLNELGVGIALNATKDGIILTGATNAGLSPDLLKALETNEDQLVRRQLHLTAWLFVSERLTKNGGPGLNPAAIAAFGDDGRYEQLCQTWSTGTLDDFKATLRAGIDAATDAPDTPTMVHNNDPTQPSGTASAEQQLPFE